MFPVHIYTVTLFFCVEGSGSLECGLPNPRLCHFPLTLRCVSFLGDISSPPLEVAITLTFMIVIFCFRIITYVFIPKQNSIVLPILKNFVSYTVSTWKIKPLSKYWLNEWAGKWEKMNEWVNESQFDPTLPCAWTQDSQDSTRINVECYKFLDWTCFTLQSGIIYPRPLGGSGGNVGIHQCSDMAGNGPVAPTSQVCWDLLPSMAPLDVVAYLIPGGWLLSRRFPNIT